MSFLPRLSAVVTAVFLSFYFSLSLSFSRAFKYTNFSTFAFRYYSWHLVSLAFIHFFSFTSLSLSNALFRFPSVCSSDIKTPGGGISAPTRRRSRASREKRRSVSRINPRADFASEGDRREAAKKGSRECTLQISSSVPVPRDIVHRERAREREEEREGGKASIYI